MCARAAAVWCAARCTARCGRARPQTEAAALLEQRLAYEEKLAQLEGQVAALNQSLKQSNERSGKLRQHYERCARLPACPGARAAGGACSSGAHCSCARRDKKALQAQLDKANKMLEGIDSEHAKEVGSTGRSNARARPRMAACHVLLPVHTALQVAQLTSKHAQEVAELRKQLEETRAQTVGTGHGV